MTQEEYEQRMRKRQTEELRQQLSASHEPLDQAVLATDPKFSGLNLTIPQTRQHYAESIMSTPEQSLPAQGPPAMSSLALDDPRLAPGRDMLVNVPKPLAGVEPISEGVRQADEIKEVWRNLPYSMRYAMASSGGVGAFVGNMMQKREAQALRIAQFHEQQNQHQAKMAYDIFTNQNLPWSQRKKMLSTLRDNPHAQIWSQVGDERLAADFQHLLPYFDKSDVEAFNKDPRGFVQNIGGLAALELKIEKARERYKASLEAQHKRQGMQELFDKYHTDPESLTETEIEELGRYTDEQQKRKMTLEELRTKIDASKLSARKTQVETNILANKPTEAYSAINPQGEKETGIYDPRTNTVRTVSGVPSSKVENVMPTNLLKDRAEIQSSIDQLKSTADLFHPDFVGTLDSMKNALYRTLNIPVTAKRTDAKTGETKTVREEDFRFAYDMLQKVLRKTLMGTAQSVQELSANPLAFPSASDKDADVTVPAFLRGQYRNLVQQLEAQDKVMDQRMRQRPMTFAERYRQLKQMAAATDMSGKNALGFTNANEMQQAIDERLHEEMKRGWVVQ